LPAVLKLEGMSDVTADPLSLPAPAAPGSSGAARGVSAAAATLSGLRLALAVDGMATLVIAVVIALALLWRGPRAAAGNRAAS
jgi:hypothetical protein